MRRRVGASYNKHSTSDTTSDMILSVNRQITVCTCWQTSSRALLTLAGPGLSLVGNETYFVDAIVTHTFTSTRIIIENIRRVFLWQTPVSPLSGTRRTLWTRLSHTSLPGTRIENVRQVFLWQTPVSPLSGTRRTLWTRLSHTSLPGTTVIQSRCPNAGAKGCSPIPRRSPNTIDQMDR